MSKTHFWDAFESQIHWDYNQNLLYVDFRCEVMTRLLKTLNPMVFDIKYTFIHANYQSSKDKVIWGFYKKKVGRKWHFK